MINDIDQVLNDRGGLKLMTHVVAGYPDRATSLRLVQVMAESGADLIEIQIPFSDPSADGAAITRANHRALEQGIRPEDVFEMVTELRSRVAVPLLLMTYANIPFRLGIERFAGKALNSGASGVIVPDLPFDQGEGREALRAFPERGLHFIPVLSPGMAESRMKSLAARASGFLYATLRVGTTGAVGAIDPAGLDFLARVRSASSLPLAAGFGISAPEQTAVLKGRADIAVVGSRLIRIYEKESLRGIEKFIRAAGRTLEEAPAGGVEQA